MTCTNTPGRQNQANRCIDRRLSFNECIHEQLQGLQGIVPRVTTELPLWLKNIFVSHTYSTERRQGNFHCLAYLHVHFRNKFYKNPIFHACFARTKGNRRRIRERPDGLDVRERLREYKSIKEVSTNKVSRHGFHGYTCPRNADPCSRWNDGRYLSLTRKGFIKGERQRIAGVVPAAAAESIRS